MQTKLPTHSKISVAILIIAALASFPMRISAQATAPNDKEIAARIDAMLAATFPADGPGAAVLILRNGEIILRKGYGLANVELDAPIAPEMVFRLGSVTKQFTAVAILMLREEGKLALTDEITKYLPGYPTHGQTITIENLLTHTSGIKDLAFLPARLAAERSDLSLAEVIALFKDEPMDFAPGERYSYSNSGYILLGAIIEKVSGMSYADFIQERIFTPLGMTHSYYDDPTQLIPGRVAGYTRTADGYGNAAYMSMSQPYAAGALASSVDDLARWDAALYTDQLVQQAHLRQAFRSYRLKSGQATGYGYGWSIGNYAGQPIIEHNGGINGFYSQVMRLPADKVYVAILTNSESWPFDLGDLAFNIATLVIGKPYQDPKAITLPAATLAAYEGVYPVNGQGSLIIRVVEGQLTMQSGGQATVLHPLSISEFFIAGAPLRVRFVKDNAGTVTALQLQKRFTTWSDLPKSDKPLPELPVGIKVDPAILAQYVGEYEADDFSLTVSLVGDTLMLTPSGEAQTELIPISESKFAVSDYGFEIEFVRDTAGAVSGLIVHMGDQDMPAGKTQ